ncbi:hypothetical protein [[Leptolyngbya] sp. PCC 7376]|uniref:DUF7919 family protein n=1 Tax=[Leptolyngbya] sp. PCC 7376 TaxID=111781 RepID=UPI00135B5957|nr:hypothetical protein [[Leptolyngbya] sp. PCC 7376]
MLHRGFHCCEFCDNATGNGQICVRHPNGNWYSAPTMLHHYVTVHHYLPPEEFIEAVLNPIEVMKPE